MMYTSLVFLLFVVISVQEAAVTFVPVGCFKDRIKDQRPRPLPELIKNFRGGLDWHNLNKTIEACAQEAREKKYLYFALQFYGECWSGPKAHLTYDRDGPSQLCTRGVGKGRTNSVYMLSGDENECTNYHVLDSADRSMTYHTSGRPKCDHWSHGFASDRWYRFTDKAGQAMADKCVESMRCQTFMSGWMNGTHPEVVDGIKERHVCFNWRKICCYRKTKISVRNCGKFYVYKLPGNTGCYNRYCGNGVTNSISI